MTMVNGINSNNVNIIDVYMKLFFFYRGQTSKKKGISGLKTRNGNKSEFKYFLVGSGLGKILGFDPLVWFDRKIPEIFYDTYTCIILAGMYVLCRKKIDIDMWECLDLLVTAYEKNEKFPLSEEQVGYFKNTVMKSVEVKKTVCDIKFDEDVRERSSLEDAETIRNVIEKWEKYKERKEKLEKKYSEEKKGEIKGKISQMVQEFEKEKNQMEKAYDNIKDMKNVPQDKLDFQMYMEREIIRYDIIEQEFEKLAQPCNGVDDEKKCSKHHIKSELCNSENMRYLNKEYLDKIKQVECGQNKVMEEEDLKKVRISMGMREDVKSIIPKVSTICYSDYLETFMTILVKYFKIYPFIPKKTYYSVGNIKFLGNKYVGKALYTQLTQIMNLMDSRVGISEIKNEDAQILLKKYSEFYYKSLDELNNLNKMELIPCSSFQKKKIVEKCATIYIMEQIFAWDLFKYEYEYIKGIKDDGKIEYNSIPWTRLGDYLGIIYNIHGVYTREKMAEEILKVFFQNINDINDYNDYRWDDFDVKIDRWTKDQKVYEKNTLNEIFVNNNDFFRKSKEIAIGNIEDIIIKEIHGKLKERNWSIYYNVCFSPRKKNIARKDWIKGVIPENEEDRELYKKIIIYSLYGKWKIKKLNK